MNPLRCSAVQEHLELYAAGECDVSLAGAIASHLAGCPDCARAHAASREMLGALELRFREPAGLERLRNRLRQEEKKRRVQPVILVFLRRAAAVAAMLFVVVGVLSLLGSLRPPHPEDGPQVAIAWKTADAQVRQLSPGRFEVNAGQVRLTVTPGARGDERDVEIVTPAGIAKTRDSEFFVEVQPARDRRGGPEAAFTVLRGKVSFANAKGHGIVKKGETLAASKNAAPASPTLLPENAVERLLTTPDAAPGRLPKQ